MRVRERVSVRVGLSECVRALLSACARLSWEWCVSECGGGGGRRALVSGACVCVCVCVCVRARVCVDGRVRGSGVW